MPAEHLIKDDDDFEEDTLFDQAGLLTNKIKKSPDIHNVHSTTMRITPMKTFALCLAFFGLGISISILEPTLLDLQYLAQVDFQQIFYTVSGRAVGSIIGLILGMVLFDRYNRQFLLFLSMLAMTVLLAIMPWCSNLVAYVLIMVVLGALMQLLYAGGNVLCLDLWGRQSGPFLQAIHFSLSVGLFIAPLLSTTITAGKAGISVSEMPERVILNNSLLLSLPASSLYSVHFRLPSLQSRHRRSIPPFEQNSSAYPTLATELVNASAIVIVANFTPVLENVTIADQHLEINATVLPLNLSEINSTSTDAMASYGGNSTMSAASTANATGITPHKPKPKPMTDAKHLGNLDPWDRNKKPSDDKPAVKSPPTTVTSLNSITTTAASSNHSVLPTKLVNKTDNVPINASIALAAENATNGEDMNDTAVNEQTNEDARKKKLPDVTDPSQQITVNANLSSSGDKVSNLTFKNESLLESENVNKTRSGSSFGAGVESSTLDSKGTKVVSMPSTDDETMSHEQTTAIYLTSSGTMRNSSPANPEKDDAIAASTEDSLAILNKATATSKEENLSRNDDDDDVLSTTMADDLTFGNLDNVLSKEAVSSEMEQPFPSSTEHPVAEPTYAKETSNENRWDRNEKPSDVDSATNSATSTSTATTSSDDRGSPVATEDEPGKPVGASNCSVYKNINGSGEHHKKPNTFNNQTEESQMLLSELLSQITAMGVTKVHIVYAVMAVIIFLTSLVFLSFLCQNPRELRSKQEEGVKPGIPESKFTSIMVGLTFVLMIFYTMAHLIFSQLYLSLVLQESVHLLHSRGSLLISVFWGIYTFSRATSICCTNGFKPVTMLLLDFVCCIVSSTTLSIAGSRVESVLWCSVAVMSIGLSSIFPYCLLWLEDYIHISNRNLCVILMGGAAVDLILSLTFGHAISLSSATVMYLVLVSCIFALLIFGIMWRLATWRGDKFGFSKADTQYHLASQIDEEEESIEFPSGNSSLYLLNGGTHFPLSSWDRKNGNSYIPLKHNNTVKWK